MAKFLQDEEVATVEPVVAEESVAETTAPVVDNAEPALQIDESRVGIYTEHLFFEGVLWHNGSALKDAVVGGKDKQGKNKTRKLPKIYGYRFRWEGDEPLTVFKDRLVAKKATETLLSNMQPTETIQVTKGQTFEVTIPALAELLGRIEFNAFASAGVIDAKSKAEGTTRVRLITPKTSDASRSKLKLGFHLKHITGVNTFKGDKADYQAISTFGINLYDKVGKDHKALEGAQLKPEFVEMFGALTQARAKSTVTRGEKEVSINKHEAGISALFRKAQQAQAQA